jgi:hypothetical protein
MNAAVSRRAAQTGAVIAPAASSVASAPLPTDDLGESVPTLTLGRLSDAMADIAGIYEVVDALPRFGARMI